MKITVLSLHLLIRLILNLLMLVVTLQNSTSLHDTANAVDPTSVPILLLVLKADLGAWKNTLRRVRLRKFFVFPQLDPSAVAEQALLSARTVISVHLFFADSFGKVQCNSKMIKFCLKDNVTVHEAKCEVRHFPYLLLRIWNNWE